MDSNTGIQSLSGEQAGPKKSCAAAALQFLGAQFDGHIVPGKNNDRDGFLSDFGQSEKQSGSIFKKNIRHDMRLFHLENTENVSASAHNEPVFSCQLAIPSISPQSTSGGGWHALPAPIHADQSPPDLRGGRPDSPRSRKYPGTWSWIDTSSDFEMSNSIKAIDLNSLFETISEALTPIFEQMEPMLVLHDGSEIEV